MRKGEEILAEQVFGDATDASVRRLGDHLTVVLKAYAITAIETAQREAWNEAIEEAAKLCDASARRHGASLEGKLTRQKELAACCFQGAYETSASSIRSLHREEG